MKAIVAFMNTDGKGHPLGWMLKDNFKHCMIALLSENGWIEIDYRMGIPLVRNVAPPDFDLNKHYEDAGYVTKQTKQAKNIKFTFNLFYGNISVANCVGLVKALLGVKFFFCFTPYQLYKRLNK